MKRMSALGLALLLVLLLALSLGCSVKREPADESNYKWPLAGSSGLYTLTSVEGHVIPYAPLREGQPGAEILGGAITLNDDGTFDSTMRYGSLFSEEFVHNFAGTYSRVGSDITLYWEGGMKTQGFLEEGTFTMDNNGLLFVFSK